MHGPSQRGRFACRLPGSLVYCLIFTFLILVAPYLPAQVYAWTTIAGNAGWGSTDGTNSAGRFWAPLGMAADQNGNLYVTDYRSDTIRKITPAGTNWVVSTLAGLPGSQGGADGTNSTARFYSPVGIAVNSQGTIFVADCYNYTVRMLNQIGTNWVVTTIAGKVRVNGSVDGTNNSAGFGFVYGIVTDTNGNVYVADGGNDSVRKLTPMGTNWVVTTIAALGAYPTGLAIDPEGILYESDRSHTIRQIVPVGTNWVVSVLAGLGGTSGIADGTNSTARFYYPGGLSADGQGHILVADSNNHTIRRLTQQGTNWVVTTIAGVAGQYGDVDGTDNISRFYYPHDIAVSTNGIFYVTDDDNYSIRSLTASGTNWVVGTIAGSGGPGSSDGTNNLSRFSGPQGLAWNMNGCAYVADQKNDTVRQLTPCGTNWIVATIAGLAGVTGSADGTNGSARFSSPGTLISDLNSNLYLADTGNSTIRKLSPQGTNWMVTTIAGQPGIKGTTDGTNTGALFNSPYGIGIDSSGNLFVTDAGAGTLRKVSLSGTNWVVTTIAGLAGYSGFLNGTNLNARFDEPLGVAVNSTGAVFIADFFNDCIRMASPVGTNWVVTTIAGSNVSAGGADGTNSNALFWNPTGVAVNSAGVVFVADTQNNSIRKITAVGTNWVVTTIGGMDTSPSFQSFIGNLDGTNNQALFNGPAGITLDGFGNLLVADTQNNTIREGVTLKPVIQSMFATNGTFVLTWSAFPQQTYQVQYKTSLLQAAWVNLGSQVLATNFSATAPDNSSAAQRFYRVVESP